MSLVFTAIINLLPKAGDGKERSLPADKGTEILSAPNKTLRQSFVLRLYLNYP
jgi:hypothetical protein